LDNNVISFIEAFNKKESEKSSDRTTKYKQSVLLIALTKIELITNKKPNDEDIEKLCKCFDISNNEFLANENLIDKLGSDENTPSIQLYLINWVIDRAISLYFGDHYQEDALFEKLMGGFTVGD
jgi:hypothetical protein